MKNDNFEIFKDIFKAERDVFKNKIEKEMLCWIKFSMFITVSSFIIVSVVLFKYYFNQEGERSSLSLGVFSAIYGFLIISFVSHFISFKNGINDFKNRTLKYGSIKDMRHIIIFSVLSFLFMTFCVEANTGELLLVLMQSFIMAFFLTACYCFLYYLQFAIFSVVIDYLKLIFFEGNFLIYHSLMNGGKYGNEIFISNFFKTNKEYDFSINILNMYETQKGGWGSFDDKLAKAKYEEDYNLMLCLMLDY